MTLFATEAYIRDLQEALLPLADATLADDAERCAAYSAAGLVVAGPSMAELREADRCALVAEIARRRVRDAGGNLRPRLTSRPPAA